MDIDEEKRLVLRVLAADWEKNPTPFHRASGIHISELNALVGANVDAPVLVGLLCEEGLVTETITKRLVLTDDGYRFIRGRSYPRTAPDGLDWFTIDNPWVYRIIMIVGAVIVVLCLIEFLLK